MTDPEQDPALSQEGVSDDASTVTDPQVTEEAAESSEKSGEGAGAQQDGTQDHAGSLEIEIAGEEKSPEPKDSAQPWVKELRKKYRDSEARAAELENKLKAYEQPAQAGPGQKPTLADCDFDEAKLETRLLDWHEKKKREDEAKAKAERRSVEERRAVQSKLDAYAKRKEELSKQVSGYAEAESAVASALGADAQALLLKLANDPALVVCALGQHPKRLDELAKETDPFHFAFKLKDLEANLTTKPKSQVPPPEKPVNGSGAVSGGKDSTLERLRAQADKTGDRTPVTDYLAKKREAERGK